MALTLAGAPFGEDPAGTFNKAMPDATGLIYFEGGKEAFELRRLKYGF